MFGAPLGHFNHKGKTKYTTVPGLILSMGLIAILLLFALPKFIRVINRNSPTITEANLPAHFTKESQTLFNLEDEINFMFAWQVSNYIDGSVKDDPEYVRW